MAQSATYPPGVASQDWNAHEAAMRELADGLLGLDKADALALCSDLGVQVRLLDLGELGNGYAQLTSEYNPNRVTLHTKSGRVNRSDH